ncbi:MAG: RNA polymerase sigma factor [Planctomycetota bacterium]
MDAERTDLIEIIKQCRQGAPEAFKKLVEKFQQKAYGIACNIIRDRELARDISQESFIRVYRSLHRFDLNKKFSPWFYQIVVNLCFDYLRKVKTRKEVMGESAINGLPDGPHSNPAQQIIRAEERNKINNVLAKLPVKYQEVLILRDMQNFSSQESAQILNCNETTVRWRLFKAREKFKEKWESIQKHENL